MCGIIFVCIYIHNVVILIQKSQMCICDYLVGIRHVQFSIQNGTILHDLVQCNSSLLSISRGTPSEKMFNGKFR